MFVYVVFLDGRFVNLARIEIESLFEAYELKPRIRNNGDRCLVVESDAPLDAVFLRSALIVEAEKVLGEDPHDICWLSVFNSGQSTNSVPLTYRVEMIDGVRDREFIDEVYRSITMELPDVLVSLENPQVTLIIRNIDGRRVITKKIATGREYAKKRQPMFRHFAPPASMDSIISRTLVNLAGLRTGDIFLDPFCGTGSLVIEAAAMGFRAIGSDINPSFVEAAKMLSELYGFIADFRVADARSLPFDDESVDGIATDPPYGISSPTYGEKVDILYDRFINEAYRILRHGGRLVVCYTPKINVVDMAESLGFRIVHTMGMYVHSGLTRMITVLET